MFSDNLGHSIFVKYLADSTRRKQIGTKYLYIQFFIKFMSRLSLKIQDLGS